MRTAVVDVLAEPLAQLPRSVQAQALRPGASLQACVTHIMRTVPREALAAHMCCADGAAWRVSAAALDLPAGSVE